MDYKTVEETVAEGADQAVSPVKSVDSQEMKSVEGDLLKSKSKWKYKRNYRKAWEGHPKLMGWLSPSSDNPERAYCRYCETTVGAHLRVLLDHARTRKHISASGSHSGASARLGVSGIESTPESEGQIHQFNEPNLELILSALATAVNQRPHEDMDENERAMGRADGEGPSDDSIDAEHRDPNHGNTVIVSPELIERLKEAQRKKAELILKVRHAGAVDRDFYEAYVNGHNLTYNALLQVCSSEIGVQVNEVRKIRKLPNTTLRSDKNVQHLKNYDELEVVT